MTIDREFHTRARRQVGLPWMKGEITDYPDADIRDLGERGMGRGAQLRVPRIDPETGTTEDADGDRSYERHTMSVIEVANFGRGLLIYRGFVEDRGPDFAPTNIFHYEEWSIWPFDPEEKIT